LDAVIHCSREFALFPDVVNVGVPAGTVWSHGIETAAAFAGFATLRSQAAVGVQHQSWRVSVLG
jgi:hypothetical protein